jgi:hypothetical protein
MIRLDQLKLNEADYTDWAKTLNDNIRQENEKRKKLKRDFLTLENYTERYTPLVILQTIRDLLNGVFEGRQRHTFNRTVDNLHVALSLSITED